MRMAVHMTMTRTTMTGGLQRVGARLLLCASVLGFVAACSNVQTVRITGLEDDSIPPEEIPGAPPVRPDAPTERTLPSCVTYCETVTAACTGEHAVYPDAAACLASCRAANWTAEPRVECRKCEPGQVCNRCGECDEGETCQLAHANSIACRLQWATAARQNPDRCEDAGIISPACDPTLGPAGQVPALSSNARCVLGLYDSSDGPGWPAGRRAREVVLKKRVGALLKDTTWDLRVHDVDGGLPSDAQVRDCSVIVSVFYDGTLRDAVDYLRWLSGNIKAGRKVVIINEVGAYRDKATGAWTQHPEVNRVLDALGVRYDGQWTKVSRELSITSWDRQYFRKKPRTNHYYRFLVSKPDVTVHLSVTRKGIDPGESAVVFTSPRGGMALTRYYESRDGFEYVKLRELLGGFLAL